MIRRNSIQQANVREKERNEKGGTEMKGKERAEKKSEGNETEKRGDRGRGKSRVEESSVPAREIMPDPLSTVGFINIHIKPPQHNRGVR